MTTPTTDLLALPADNPEAKVELARIMVYGAPKTRKSWWAGTACETHRVTVLDGENGLSILHMINENDRKRIRRVPLSGIPAQPALATFCSLLFKKHHFLWCLEEAREVQPIVTHIKPEHTYVEVNLNLLDHNDVLVIESWTKLTADCALQYMLNNGLDPIGGQAGKKNSQGKEDTFDHYHYMDLVLNAILHALGCMPCHVIVTGHETDYTSKVKEGLVKVEKTKKQIISSTGKHAAKLPGGFSDVLWFEAQLPTEAQPFGTTIIDATSDPDRQGGTRCLPPAKYKFEELPFKEYCKLSKIDIPETLPEHQSPAAFAARKGTTVIEMLGGIAPVAPIPSSK